MEAEASRTVSYSKLLVVSLGFVALTDEYGIDTLKRHDSRPPQTTGRKHLALDIVKLFIIAAFLQHFQIIHFRKVDIFVRYT